MRMASIAGWTLGFVGVWAMGWLGSKLVALTIAMSASQ
jgi:hypothetical protein